MELMVGVVGVDGQEMTDSGVLHAQMQGLGGGYCCGGGCGVVAVCRLGWNRSVADPC